VTVGLVLLSAHCGCHRIGGVIMFFFDWADPFLLIAKALKYLSKHPQDVFQNSANVMFVLFALSFFLTHNVMFNYVVSVAFRDFWGTYESNVCCILLFLLVILQTYWLGLLIQAIYVQVKNGGNVEDVREDDKKKDK
jgi:TLC domain